MKGNPMPHRDGPLNFNQEWKAYRLADGGWEVETIARMWGRTEAEITAAIDSCKRALGTTPPAEDSKAA